MATPLAKLLSPGTVVWRSLGLAQFGPALYIPEYGDVDFFEPVAASSKKGAQPQVEVRVQDLKKGWAALVVRKHQWLPGDRLRLIGEQLPVSLEDYESFRARIDRVRKDVSEFVGVGHYSVPDLQSLLWPTTFELPVTTHRAIYTGPVSNAFLRYRIACTEENILVGRERLCALADQVFGSSGRSPEPPKKKRRELVAA